MMRYRPASNRPGRNRPSLRANAPELGGREDEDEADAGRRGRGDSTAANSRVATSSDPCPEPGAATVAASETDVSVASSEPTGAPQAEQKRLAIGTSARQDVQRGMIFPADSVTRSSATGMPLDLPISATLGSNSDICSISNIPNVLRAAILPRHFPVTMNKAQSDRVHELCSLIEKEQDERKFLNLIQELNEILSEKESRLRKGGDPGEKSD